MLIHNINGDEGRISQIILNFLSNAFKFTPPSGQITIEVNPRGSSYLSIINDQDQLHELLGNESSEYILILISFQIRIKDSGIGIKEEDIGKLFKQFGMLKDERGMNARGTGLGLNICKNLIERMGGSVSVESEGVDRGTTFAINLRTESKVS